VKNALALAALVAALALGACSTVQGVLNAASLSPAAVIVVGNGFDAAEATATNYLTLPACATGGPTICRTPAAVKAIVPIVRAGRQERNALEAACGASTSSTACVSAYQSLSATVNSLQSLFTQYGVQKAGA
jgi:hypothetical protein